MSRVFTSAMALVALLAVTGCQKGYESDPVFIKSDKGQVTCQLYTVDRTYWDEAIRIPEGLSQEEADALCLAEGERRKQIYLQSQKTTE